MPVDQSHVGDNLGYNYSMAFASEVSLWSVTKCDAKILRNFFLHCFPTQSLSTLLLRLSQALSSSIKTTECTIGKYLPAFDAAYESHLCYTASPAAQSHQ
jgi:hypothetical protein